MIVSPPSVTLVEIGATQQFSAEVRDATGQPLSTAPLTWSSSDTTVATVDTSGLATGRDSGVAYISATADGVSDSARLAVDTTSSSGLAEVAVPSQSEWTDQGIVVPLGDSGDWDLRIDGSLTPSTVVKVDGTIHLYYVGADGDRSSDGGPANRALGVATSSDGISFTKYSGNPVITHQPDGGHGNVEEEGVFSAGGWVQSDGTVDMYYGGMESTSSSSVDSDGVLEYSSDGFAFSGQQDVFRNEDSNTVGNDELFPFAAFQDGGTWNVYYIAKGGVSWAVALASGPARDDLSTHQLVLDTSEDIKGGGNVIFLSDSKILVPLGFEPNPHDYQMRTTTVDNPSDLSNNAATYTFDAVKEGTFYLDREIETWFFYFITEAEDGIHLKTAPMRLK